MTEPEWERVNEATGDFARPEKLENHLVIVWALGYVPHIQTKFTTQGKKSDAVSCDIVDLDDVDQNGMPGKVYRNSNMMQGKLIAQLKNMIGTKCLGVFQRGVPSNGMNAPWILTDLSGDVNARARANAWLAANPFTPSRFTLPAAPPPPPPAATEPYGWPAGAQPQRPPQPQAPQYPPQQPQYGYPPQAPPAYQPPPAYAPPAPPAYQPPPQQPQYQPPQYQQPAPPAGYQQVYQPQQQQPRPPQPNYQMPQYPVPGAAPLSTEELDNLQRMRMARAQREQDPYADAAAALPTGPDFGDNPPF